MTVRCEWGLKGVELLRDRAGVIVIVDVLSFTTAVDVATARGALIYPHAYDRSADGAARAEEAARAVGAVLALPRKVAAGGQYSLSPASLAGAAPAARIMLPSPNGSTLTLACGDTPVFAGCLRNATALADSVRAFAGGRDIAVIPAGERWPQDDSLRPAIEDWLGAGAIISALGLPCAPEAELARISFEAARADFAHLIRTSMSGRELIEGGYEGDVEMAIDLDVSDGAPLLVDGAYRQ
ncbi:2-phosphosulfolactate phosphatase [Sphingobium nicotianae]|uniref:Probable 2-phosphosulfolactate phosphatase n=1 Tax=Sphingobium nicotianae TaxID=2782607 RepID=A0A9X1IRX4_9SPHN|nr:2-phosphosulfolactate phosphatase [Sphingobium nicotianae]MBT2187951.1 2-phosphosulfolactate phosphatase [Sphingobium nicotianae]